jgi:hypothetical protein
MGLAAEDLGLSRFEGKEILSELQCLVLQTWIEEFTQGRNTRPVRNMLDWLHISMRIRPIEQAIGGLLARSSCIASAICFGTVARIKRMGRSGCCLCTESASPHEMASRMENRQFILNGFAISRGAALLTIAMLSSIILSATRSNNQYRHRGQRDVSMRS